MQLVLSDAISLRFMVPPGWFAQGKPMMAGKASHIEMFSMTGKHKLKLTVLVPQGETVPFEAQTKMVEANLAKQLERSVEDKVTLVTAKTDGAQFVYGTLTDKALVGKPVPRGQWRHVTSGLSKHSGFVVTMSLYSQEKDDPGHAVAIAAWQAMTGASALPLVVAYEALMAWTLEDAGQARRKHASSSRKRQRRRATPETASRNTGP